MEDELFDQLYQQVQTLAIRRRPREQYSDKVILLVYFWAVLHDRPTGWACQQRHWPIHQRHWPKPSPSRMSRRLKHVQIQSWMQQLEQRLRPAAAPPMVKTLDAKPLAIGSYSKDRHARWGQAGKAKAKGYKLFALCDAHGLVAWRVHDMARSETEIARTLIPALDGGGYLLADSLYDSNALFDLAGVCNHRLVAPRKKPGTGLGNRRHSPLRRQCIERLEHVAPYNRFGPQLYAQRTSIERTFGHMGNFAAGLGPLPNWVRTLPRVRRWVHAKIILNAIRLARKQALAA